MGSETTFFLGYQITPGYEIARQHAALQNACDLLADCGSFHLTALYDLVGAGVLLIALLLLRQRWTSQRYGQLFAVWALWYGLQRVAIDFTRLDAARNQTTADSVIGPLTGSQWGALTIAVIGLLLFRFLSRTSDSVTPEGDIARGARAAEVASFASPPTERANT